jgi:hypothetical protein
MDQNIDNHQIFEVIKFIQTDILSKITALSVIITDISRQLNILVILDSQPPSRLELLEKLKSTFFDISQTININLESSCEDTTDLLQKQFEKTDLKLIRYDGVIISINDIISKINALSNQFNGIDNKITNSLNSYKSIFRILVIIASIIPMLWGIFIWAHSQGFIK